MPRQATRLHKLRITRCDIVTRGANQHAAILIHKAAMTCPECGATMTGPMKPGDACPECGHKMTAGDMSVAKAMKTEGGRSFPAGDYAYVPDPNSPSTWKLRLTSTPGAAPDPGIVGAALAALGPGFRGQKVQIPAGDLAAVKAKVRAAWRKAHPGAADADVPAILKGGDTMSDAEQLAELRKAIDAAVAEATAPLQAELDRYGVEKAAFEEAVKAAKGDEINKADLPEAVRKKLEDAERVAKAAEERIAKLEDQRDTERWTSVAKGLDMVAVAKAAGGDAVGELATLLKSVNKAAPDAVDALVELLTVAQTRASESALLREAGAAAAEGLGDAEAQLEKVASEIRKADGNLTPAQAYREAIKRDPALAARAQKEAFGA